MDKTKYFQKNSLNRLGIAEKMGVDTNFVTSYWNDNSVKNSIADVIKLCNYFQIDIDDYFANTIETNQSPYFKKTTEKSIKEFDPIDFGNIIRELRISKNISTADFAEKLGTTERAIQYYEAGQRTPRLETLIAIAIVLNVSPSYLLL